MRNAIKVFPVGRGCGDDRSVFPGSRSAFCRNVCRWMISILAGCDPVARSIEDLEELLTCRTEERNTAGRSEKPTRCQTGDGKDGLLDRRRKTTANRDEINNKLGQIHPYKSGGGRVVLGVPFFFARPSHTTGFFSHFSRRIIPSRRAASAERILYRSSCLRA